MALTSKVQRSKPGTKSLKTTVPEGIAEFLQLQAGDRLAWYMSTPEDDRGSWIAIVRKENVSG